MHAFAPARVIGAADRAIAALAGRQFGAVSRAQLLALGLTDGAIDWRVRAGRLHPVHRGVYFVGHQVAPTLGAEMAAQLACEPSSVVSHRSAASYWQLRAPGVSATASGIVGAAPVEIVVIGREPHPQPGIRIHRRREMRAADIHRDGPLRVTSAPRTLLDLVRSASLPAPEVNALVAGHEVDFFWREQGVIVEIDGRAFHSDPRAFERDRIRDAELAAAGCVVIRVTWRQLVDHPHAVLARLRATLRRRAGRLGVLCTPSVPLGVSGA